MKHLILIGLMIYSSALLFCQKHDFIWLTGYPSELENPTSDTFGISIYDFNPDTSLRLINNQEIKIGFDFANVSLCDTLGNLLFYSNGIQINNAVHEIIENGAEINEFDRYGYKAVQGILALPHPKGNHIYAFLHGTGQNFVNGEIFIHMPYLWYSEIDMSKNEGLGAVTLRMDTLVNDTLAKGRLMAVKHGNGRDWWIIVEQLCPIDRCFNNEFVRLLLTPEGIRRFPNQKIFRSFGTETGVGQAFFTPDGKYYISPNSVRVGDPHYLDIYDFDRCTGWMTNKGSINDMIVQDINDGGGGLSISPNSRFVYHILRQRIIQYDLWASNIEASAIKVAEYDGFLAPFPTYFFLGQLAPDGKIYINSANGTRYLHVIHNPNEKGLACNVEQHGILLPTYNSFSLPNFPNYRLGAWEGSPCDTLSPISFTKQIVANEVKFFPNPSTGFLQLELEEDVPISQLEVRFYSLTGQLIQSLQGQNTFDLIHFSNGIYIASVFINGQVVGREKIVVQR
ncbi:MAG: T9SS type A sorting domain-containing protein [Bacteroidota bacterium]